MLSQKAWMDGMAELNAYFPAANKSLSEDDIAVRDLAYHKAIAPLFGNEAERKERPRLMREEAWALAVVDVARTWEYPFALPPPSELIEAARDADHRIAPNEPRRTEEEREEARRLAAEGLALIEAKLAESGAKLLPHQLPVRNMRALAAAPGDEPTWTDEDWAAKLARAREQTALLLAKYPLTVPSPQEQSEVHELAELVVEATKAKMSGTYDDWKTRSDRDEYADRDCARCDNEGEIMICPDDMCRGAGECMHGDGMAICPACHGESYL